jgi:TonB family protein
VNTLRIATAAAALAVALPGVAGGAVTLVPLAPATVAATRQCTAAVASPPGIAYAQPADLPPIAAEQHVTGTTAVLVNIDARGRLIDSAVLASSGNSWIDRAALHAARGSRYTAEVRDCAPVGGVYAFVVDFTK